MHTYEKKTYQRDIVISKSEWKAVWNPCMITCNTLQRTATYCNALHRTATHCIVLQHTAVHCSALQMYLHCQIFGRSRSEMICTMKALIHNISRINWSFARFFLHRLGFLGDTSHADQIFTHDVYIGRSRRAMQDGVQFVTLTRESHESNGRMRWTREIWTCLCLREFVTLTQEYLYIYTYVYIQLMIYVSISHDHELYLTRYI